MDELLKNARAAITFVSSIFSAVWAVLKAARVPSDSIKLTADEMTINYKAVTASIILLFLARALEGQLTNDASGSVLVVGIFVGLVGALKYGSDGLARLVRYLRVDKSTTSYEDASHKWFSLLVAIWTWGAASGGGFGIGRKLSRHEEF